MSAVPVGSSSLCSGDFLTLQQVASSMALRDPRSLVSDMAEDRLGWMFSHRERTFHIPGE